MSIEDLSEYSGYRQLWTSVLLQAIKDLEVEREAVSAKWWIYESPEKGPGSFHWICSCLDLDENVITQTCTTREGRRKILGSHYTGLHAYKDRMREGKCQKPKSQKRVRLARKTSRSRKN